MLFKQNSMSICLMQETIFTLVGLSMTKNKKNLILIFQNGRNNVTVKLQLTLIKLMFSAKCASTGFIMSV